MSDATGTAAEAPEGDRAPLAFEVTSNGTPRDGAPVLVLLHGRGADRHDLGGIAGWCPKGTTVVTPEAPHPGRPWGYGPGWAWYRYVQDDRIEADTLAHSLACLDDFLGGLAARLPAAPGPLILGGFSQGGTTSLAWALTRGSASAGTSATGPESPSTVPALPRLAGVIVFSGFLVDAPDVVPLTAGALDNVPVFWGHGTLDPAIPFALGQRGRTRLGTLGADLTTGDYPMGHQISGPEFADVLSWMEDRGWLG